MVIELKERLKPDCKMQDLLIGLMFDSIINEDTLEKAFNDFAYAERILKQFSAEYNKYAADYQIRKMNLIIKGLIKDNIAINPELNEKGELISVSYESGEKKHV